MTLHPRQSSTGQPAIEPRSTTSGPVSTCWYCGERFVIGCVHHCPTSARPGKYA